MTERREIINAAKDLEDGFRLLGLEMTGCAFTTIARTAADNQGYDLAREILVEGERVAIEIQTQRKGT